MPKMTQLSDLFVKELRDMYDAEKQITKALSHLINAASSEELRGAFEDHLDETKAQIERLEQVFDHLEMTPRGLHCAGMAGILEEGSALIEEDGDPAVLDAGFIGAAQRVEHYEMAAYGTLLAFARQLGLDDVATLLEQSLEEEKAADRKLSDLAEIVINPSAQQPAMTKTAGKERRR